ncbi:hypothetical protein ABMA28_003633 [Loxostege sticticalis]|uniref:Uncharacterized protein n=1 Tax=Loxostege sticticalis TaxID=481309 RepID=A0ABD0SWN5_LOXSC
MPKAVSVKSEPAGSSKSLREQVAKPYPRASLRKKATIRGAQSVCASPRTELARLTLSEMGDQDVVGFVPPQNSDAGSGSVPTGPTPDGVPAEEHDPEVRPGVFRARAPVAAPVAEIGGQPDSAPTPEPAMRPAELDTVSGSTRLSIPTESLPS